MTMYNELIKRSDWNFDWKQSMSEKHVKYLGNIKGDWKLDEIKKDICPCGPKSYQQVEEVGGSLENAWDYNQVDIENHPNLYRLAQLFYLKDLFVELHVQRPGQMHPLHMDMGALGGSDRVDRSKQVVRLFVMLADWMPGQLMMIGSEHFTKWNKGDVIFFDWYNVPHGTCNFGHHDRPLLSVTGTITADFKGMMQDRPFELEA